MLILCDPCELGVDVSLRDAVVVEGKAVSNLDHIHDMQSPQVDFNTEPTEITEGTPAKY